MLHRVQEVLRSIAALAVYWLRVFPLARRELGRWELRARAIPEPALRRVALDKLRDEGICAEGVAAFGIVATTNRAAVVRFCVAFEVIYDFVDGLGEQPTADPLANNRQLSRAYMAALDPAAPLVDFYCQLHYRDDGGYLDALIATCRQALATLQSYAAVADAMRCAAGRAAEAQSLNHSGTLAGDLTPLERWAAEQWSPGELHWWETAAAAAAPLDIYALSALAADRCVTAHEVAGVEAAYFPWIAGLLGVLESVVDRDEDAAGGTHSYVEHYDSHEQAARRAALFAHRSAEHVGRLRKPVRHRVILAGMVATNLSHHGAGDDVARIAGANVRERLDGPVGVLLALLRARRYVKRHGRVGLSGAA